MGDSDGYGYSESNRENFFRAKIWFDIRQNDYDNDGLKYWEEVNVYGTDPTNWDTDGDGLLDGIDVWYDPDMASHEVVVAQMRFEKDIDLYNRTASEDITVNWVTYTDMSYRTQAAAYVRDSYIVVAADVGTLTGLPTGSVVEIEVMGVLNGEFVRFWPRTIAKTIDNWYDNDFSTFRYTSTTPLPDEIGVHRLRLYWRITTYTGTNVIVSEQMTRNIIYTTWQAPLTNVPGKESPYDYWDPPNKPEGDPRKYVETIEYSCIWASGKNTEKEIMDAIFDGMWNEAYSVPAWRYTLGEGSLDGLILKTDTGSCGTWAAFYHSLVESQGIDVTWVSRFLVNCDYGSWPDNACEMIGGEYQDRSLLRGHDIVMGGTSIDHWGYYDLNQLTDEIYDPVCGFRGDAQTYYQTLDIYNRTGTEIQIVQIYDLNIDSPEE